MRTKRAFANGCIIVASSQRIILCKLAYRKARDAEIDAAWQCPQQLVDGLGQSLGYGRASASLDHAFYGRIDPAAPYPKRCLVQPVEAVSVHVQRCAFGSHGGAVNGDGSPVAGCSHSSIVIQRGTDACSRIRQHLLGFVSWRHCSNSALRR